MLKSSPSRVTDRSVPSSRRSETPGGKSLRAPSTYHWSRAAASAVMCGGLREGRGFGRRPQSVQRHERLRLDAGVAGDHMQHDVAGPYAMPANAHRHILECRLEHLQIPSGRAPQSWSTVSIVLSSARLAIGSPAMISGGGSLLPKLTRIMPPLSVAS